MTTIEDIARKHGMKLDAGETGGPRWKGRNPYEAGATENGFHLFPLGSKLDGSEKGGCAWQRTPSRFYSAQEIARLEGIPYQDYEGSLSDTRNGKGFIVPNVSFDTRSLEERGLNEEAQRNWNISNARGKTSPWGESRIWPTYFPNGATGRSRVKFRYPAKQLALPNYKGGSPAKTIWDKATESLGMPVAYGLNLIEPGATVWLVNSELAVWLFWQEGLTAICPLGEGRSEKSYNEIVREVRAKKAGELRVLLDNDTGGRTGSARAWKAVKDTGLSFTIYDLSTAPKEKYDASDLWEFWRQSNFEGDAEEGTLIRVGDDFEEFLHGQSVANVATLTAWDSINAKIENAAQLEAATQKGGSLADQIEKGRKGEDDTKDGDAEKLLKMLRGHQMFHTESQDCYIVIDFPDGQRKIFDINSGSFGQWVRYIYNRDTGKVAKEMAVKSAVATLAAQALYDEPEMAAHNRIAAFGGKFYLDLCNKSAEVVEISAQGWRVTKDCPVFFKRAIGMQELPYPVRDPQCSNTEVWGKFRANINYGEERNWILIVAWMVSALVPGRWPCPILSVNGEQGSAKSWLTRLVRQTVDPNDGFMVQTIKEEKDVVVVAEKMRVVALDNQSHMPEWMSNLLAAMVTGTPYMCRTLFTNDDHKTYKGQPAIILNGIPERIGGIDFNDRALKLFIPKLVDKGYREEAEVTEEWEQIRPALLCAILDAMVCGLKNYPRKREIKDGRTLPRMADFATWVMCCEEALPFELDSFYNAYSGNIEESAAADLEGFFPTVVMEFAKTCVRFSGTPGELHDALHNQAILHLVEREHDAVLAAKLSAVERERHRERVKERVSIELSKMKSWPHTPTSTGVALTKISPSLLKSAKISCFRGTRNSLGTPWCIHDLSEGSDEAGNKMLGQAPPKNGKLNFDDDPFDDAK